MSIVENQLCIVETTVKKTIRRKKIIKNDSLSTSQMQSAPNGPTIIHFRDRYLDLSLPIRESIVTSSVSCLNVVGNTGYDFKVMTQDECDIDIVGQCMLVFDHTLSTDETRMQCVKMMASGLIECQKDCKPYSPVYICTGDNTGKHIVGQFMERALGTHYFARVSYDELNNIDCKHSSLSHKRFVVVDIPESVSFECVQTFIHNIRNMYPECTQTWMLIYSTNSIAISPKQKNTFNIVHFVFEPDIDGLVSSDYMHHPEFITNSRDAIMNMLLNAYYSFEFITPGKWYLPISKKTNIKSPKNTTTQEVGQKSTKSKVKQTKTKEFAPLEKPITLDFVNKFGLAYSNSLNPAIYEIGVDEVGRGALFGRAYIAAVVLPPPETITPAQLAIFHEIRDSKKITTTAKMDRLANFVRETCPYWSVQFQESGQVDELNIKEAVLVAMRNGITDIMLSQPQILPESWNILADGIEFTKFKHTPTNGVQHDIQVKAIDKGDNRYIAIACASILAKSTRDTYVIDMCKLHPHLSEWYGLHSNMGYGTQLHMSGITQHGVTEWHRRSFNPVRVSLGLAVKEGGGYIRTSGECLL